MASYTTGRRRFIITLTQGAIALGMNQLTASPILDITACHHSPELEVVHHPELPRLQALLRECCQRLQVPTHHYNIEMVRYVNQDPYLNAQTCRTSGQIWLGERLWDSFKEDPYVLQWVLLHEIGHSLLQQAAALASVQPRNQEDLRFMEQFKPGPREELNCDRIAMKGMLRCGYSASHIRRAIIAMASLLKSPAVTSARSSHPGYRDRLLNVASFLR